MRLEGWKTALRHGVLANRSPIWGKPARTGLEVVLTTIGLLFAAFPKCALASEPVTALTFSPDSRSLLSGSYGKVTVRSVKGSGSPRTLVFPLLQIHALAFQPGGKRLAVGGGTPGTAGIVCLSPWPEGRMEMPLRDHTDLVTALAFHPNGTLLATASADRTVVLRRIPSTGSDRPVHVLTGHTGAVLAVAFSPDGTLLLSAGVDRSLKVWDVASGKLLRSLDNHTDTIHSLTIRPPTKGVPLGTPFQCATVSEDRTARVWQPEIGRMVRIVRGAEGGLLAVAYARDGRFLYTAGVEGIVRVVDADSDRVLNTGPPQHAWIYSLAVSPDGRTLATADSTGKVLWRSVDP